MEKSFISRIKTLFLGNTPYRITRSFALRMLPLSFLAGIFICIAIPVSYYYLERIDAGKRANTHANDIASFFSQVLEAHPLTWKEEVNSKLAVADIDCIRILDRHHNLIAHLTTCNVPEESWSLVKGEKEVTYGGDTYAVVTGHFPCRNRTEYVHVASVLPGMRNDRTNCPLPAPRLQNPDRGGQGKRGPPDTVE